MIDVTFCQQWKQDWKWTGLCLKLRQEQKKKTIFPIVRSLVWGTMRSGTILRLPLFLKVILLFLVQGKRLDCRLNEFRND